MRYYGIELPPEIIISELRILIWSHRPSH